MSCGAHCSRCEQYQDGCLGCVHSVAPYLALWPHVRSYQVKANEDICQRGLPAAREAHVEKTQGFGSSGCPRCCAQSPSFTVYQRQSGASEGRLGLGPCRQRHGCSLHHRVTEHQVGRDLKDHLLQPFLGKDKMTQARSS